MRSNVIRPFARAREQDGTILVLALVVLSILLMLGLSLVERATIESSTNETDWSRRRVFYAAQAGIEHGKKKLLENPKWRDAVEANFDEGTSYSVTFEDLPPPGPGKQAIRITSTARGGELTRTIKETIELAGNYSDVLYDSTVNTNDGKLYRFNLGACWVDGKAGFQKCLQFDGTDDYVKVPYDATLDGGEQGGGGFVNVLANPEFNDTSAWTYADWQDSSSLTSGSIETAGGNPAGYAKILFKGPKTSNAGSGYFQQAVSFTTVPSQAQVSFEWNWNYTITGGGATWTSSLTYVRAYLDSSPGAPTNMVWGFPLPSYVDRPWEKVGPIDVKTSISVPGTYYLKLVMSAGSKYVDFVAGFDNVKLEIPSGGPGGAQRTTEAWVFPTALRSMPVLSKRNSYGLDLVVVGADMRARAWFSMGGAIQDVVSLVTIPVNAWSHIAGTFDGTTIKLYVGGLESGQKAATAAIDAPVESLIIGSDREPTLLPFVEDWESGGFSVGGWLLSEPPPTVGTENPHGGAYSVAFLGGRRIDRKMDTKGSGGIVVEGWTAIVDGGDPMGMKADRVYVDYSTDGGASWPYPYLRLDGGTDGTAPWTRGSVQLGAAADNNQSLVVRLIHYAYAAADRAWLDDVRIYALTAPPAPNYFAGKLDEMRISGVARTSFPLTPYDPPDASTSALWHCEPPEGGSGVTVKTLDWE